MNSPQQQQRRDFRYPLHLPVLVQMKQRRAMHTRSENISLGGILLSSAFLIPEGSTVEVSVGVDHLPDPGILLNARGKVLRVQPRSSGDFSIAIKLDAAFGLPLTGTQRITVAEAKKSLSSGSFLSNPILGAGANLALAWHTET